ncbi:signal peptidase II [Senegalia massiliensis]|uniref:Lipoprotein signal peptidase n=1 Tax=Senegalia massiliensis TaxID=1720316 RepID=A0A845R0B6_9CLOT|nr:signal peptidase II [Senegalia massiliensis]NBI06898.1 signal peptidase II [Senegalia massiliensis]
MYIIPILIIILDQLTKYFSVVNLEGEAPIVLIENFLQLNYVRNYGAAFGIMNSQRTFFLIITIIIVFGIIFYINKYNNTKIMNYSLVMIIGGAIGNFIDRLRVGYVIDFIDVNFGEVYDFPVFNIADSFIVIGTILLVILVMTDNYEDKGKE